MGSFRRPAQPHLSSAADVEAWRSMTLLLNSKKRRRFLIDPRMSTRLAWWDSFGSAILVFTVCVLQPRARDKYARVRVLENRHR